MSAPASIDPGREHGPRDRPYPELPVDAARGVRERREDDRERPGDRPPAAAGVEPGERRDTEEAERDAGDAHRRRRARAGGSAAASRNVKIGTVDCAMPATLESMCFSPHATSQNGIAALIAPSTRHGAPARRGARRPRATRPCATREVREQDDAGDEDAQLGHRGRLDVLDGDLDEEVRRAPDRREEEDQRPVAHAPSEATRRTRRSRPRRLG